MVTSITARRVVLTLPQNILGDLDVNPPLNAGKLAAAAEKTASQGTKAWIRVRGPIEPFFAYSDGGAPAFGRPHRVHRRR